MQLINALLVFMSKSKSMQTIMVLQQKQLFKPSEVNTQQQTMRVP